MEIGGKIPKIIHFCWFSDDPYPPKIRKCIDSWHRCLPDYEIKKWDYSTFPRGKCKWVDEAFDLDKYAFVADYIRAYALYNEGGIYLDSDVEVLKSFDTLLDLPYFIGKEVESPVEAAVMGSQTKHPLFGMLLNYYNTRTFVKEDGTLNKKPMPFVIDKLIKENFIKSDALKLSDIKCDDNTIYILPSDYFSPKSYVDGKIRLTSNTYSIHHFSGSWLTRKEKFNIRLASFIRLIRNVIEKCSFCSKVK